MMRHASTSGECIIVRLEELAHRMNHARLQVGNLRRPVTVDAKLKPVSVEGGVNAIPKVSGGFGNRKKRHGETGMKSDGWIQ